MYEVEKLEQLTLTQQNRKLMSEKVGGGSSATRRHRNNVSRVLLREARICRVRELRKQRCAAMTD